MIDIFLACVTLSLFEWYYNGIYYIGLEFSHSLPYHITEGSELSLINLVIRLSMTQFSSIQFNALSCPPLCDPMDCSRPGFPVYHLLPEVAQNHVHCISDVIQPSRPLPSLSPPAFNLPQIIFCINSYNEYSRLISFRIDWLDLLAAVQGTLKSLLQHHSSKASILCHSALFIVQLSHPYMTTGKKIYSLWLDVPLLANVFNMLSR